MSTKPFFPLRLETIRDLAIAVQELAKRFNTLAADEDKLTSTVAATAATTTTTTSTTPVSDVSSSAHGLAPQSPGDPTTFLNGDNTPAYVAVKGSDLSMSDVPTNNVSIAQHGFAPKAPNNPAEFLDGTGNYSVPVSIATRSNVVIVTAALANLASEALNAALARHTMALLLVQADRACWVRFYASAAAQIADAARLITAVGVAGTGLLGDFRFSAATTILVSPVAMLANEEVPAQLRVWYTIQNLSGALSAVTVTLTLIPLEP